MRHFLIGGFIMAFLLGSAPVMAEPDQRRAMLSGSADRGADKDRGRVIPVHKKYLTSRYRDDHGHHGGHRSRGHDRRVFGRKGHGGRHDGWKQGKRHHWERGHHGQKRHWQKHRRNHDRHSGYRYRFHYNGLVGHGVNGGQIVIDLSRH